MQYPFPEKNQWWGQDVTHSNSCSVLEHTLSEWDVTLACFQASYIFHPSCFFSYAPHYLNCHMFRVQTSIFMATNTFLYKKQLNEQMRCCTIYSNRKRNFKKQIKSLSTVSKSSLCVGTSVSVCICFLVLCFSQWLWLVNIYFLKISQYVKLVSSRQVEILSYLMAYQQSLSK